jgi:hypothetical protein
MAAKNTNPKKTTSKTSAVKPAKVASKKSKRADLAALAPTVSQKISPPRNSIHFYQAGSSGLREYSGFVQEAHEAILQWPGVYPLYNRIIRSSPEITAMKLLLTAWARQLKFVVNLPADATEDDIKYKEFVESDFKNMEGGPAKLLEEFISAMLYGWAWWDVQASIRNPEWMPPQEPDEPDDWRSEEDDDLFGIRRIDFRSQGTFQRWEFTKKSKRMTGMWQQDFPNTAELLHKDNSLHLTFGDPNNPEGATPLEASYRLERIKYAYETIMGIGSEHTAGYLKIKKETEGEIGTTDQAAIDSTANNLMSAQEGNYGYFPYGLDGEIMDIPFQSGSFVLDTVRFYAIQMLQTFGMKFLASNVYTSTGALSAISEEIDLAILTFNSIFEGFGAQYDQQVGKRLWKWNKDFFPGATRRPKISISKLERPVALSELGSFLSSIDGKMLLGGDDYRAIRRRSGILAEEIPDMEVENMDELVPPKPQPIIPQPPAPTDQPLNTDEDSEPEKKPAEDFALNKPFGPGARMLVTNTGSEE